MNVYSILAASLIPLGFLYIVKWLNFLQTHRLRLILLALVWGAFSVELSYLVDHPIRLIMGFQFIGTHTAPTVEEVFKSLILLYLVRRADTTFFVDGAVYGFASGIGFAIAENMLYLSRVNVDTGVVIATSRAFVASVMHGSTTAIVGMMLAGFPLGKINHPLLRWVVGLVIAISIHTTFNASAFHRYVFGQTGLLVLAGIAMTALFTVAAMIMWGLRRERRRFRKSFGNKLGGVSGEARLVQNAEDWDELLAPVEARFGEAKREQAAAALLLAAQLAMKQDQIRKTRDPEVRAQLAPQITQLKVELRQARHAVGIYIMSYVRSIMPKTTWSLWARLGQILAKREPSTENLWQALAGRAVGHNSPPEGMYAKILADMEARTRAGRLAGEGEH